MDPGDAVTVTVAEGDAVTIPGPDASFGVLDIPGQTRAHIAYYRPGFLFCGDTLLARGCRRLFDGTAPGDLVPMFAAIRKWKNRFR